MDLYRMTAEELSALLEKKELSATELVKAQFERIHAVEPDVQSYITLTEEGALRRAAEIDKRRAEGEQLPKLAGIPVGIKDNLCTKGVRTTCASKMLGNFEPVYSATAVEKLEDAGLVMTGKLNMDEFAMGSSTENSAFQQTKNPRDLTRVPGGSSGGSAAAVAAGECTFALGSDTGGSIRQPAGFCGVVGFKPTYGTVSRYGLVAFASSLDQIGPLARSVKDAALLCDLITGRDPRDTTSVPGDGSNYYGSLNPDMKGKVLGLPKEFFDDGISDEVKSAVLAAAKVYEGLGATVKEVSVPLIDYSLPTYYILSSAEASSNLARYDGVKYGFRAAEFDGLVDMYNRTRSEGFGSEVKRRIMLGTYVLSSGYYDAYYKRAQKVQRLLRQSFDEVFSGCDALITPTSPTTAFKLGEKLSDSMQMYLTDICTVSINIAGLPAMSLPCGRDKEGLPIGLQLIGNRFCDQTIFDVGAAFEAEFGRLDVAL